VAVFAEPLIEGDLFKCRVKRAEPAGRLSHAGDTEEQEYETVDHSTFYSFAEPNRACGF
jgi:hypothetical protein